MKIQDKCKKNPKLDAFSTLAPLNYTLKIFGLSCIYRDGVTLKYISPIWRFSIYIILVFAVNASLVVLSVKYDDGREKFTFTDAIQLVYILGYIQYISDIICVYKYGRQSYVDYFNLYDYIDSTLGMTHYKQIKKCINNMWLLFIFIFILTIIIELSTWTIHYNWIVIIIYSIELLYLGIKLLAILDIIANYVQVKYRLETIGDLLENYYYNADNIPSVVEDVVYDNVWITSQNGRKLNNLDCSKRASISQHDIMLRLSRCYILLIEQSDFINLKYGFRLLLNCSFYLLDMVLLINLTIRLLLGTLLFISSYVLTYLLISSTIARILSYTITLFCGIHQCEQTYRQTERITRMIDHLLITKKLTNEMQEAFKELRDVIVSRPIVYNALNFFRLDYATLVSMASVIVTYTIILLQSLQ